MKRIVHAFYIVFCLPPPDGLTSWNCMDFLGLWGSFGRCKLSYRGPKCRPSWSDRDGRHFGPRGENSRAPKLLSGTSEFLAMSNFVKKRELSFKKGDTLFISANHLPYPWTWHMISEKLYCIFMVWRNYSHGI